MVSKKASGRYPEVWPQTVLTHLLKRFVREGLLHVLVEGGANVHQQFLEQDLFDELWLFVAPKLAGGEGVTWSGELGIKRMADAKGLVVNAVERLGDDLLMRCAPHPAVD